MRAAAYLIFTVALAVVLALIVRRTYDRRRRDAIESPKHRMLDD